MLDTRPAIGTVLNQGDYENFKKSLTSIALRKGYFDSEFTKAQLGIALGLHKAFWDIDYNSGERYRFGHVTFEGSQIRDEYLQNLVPFKAGSVPLTCAGVSTTLPRVKLPTPRCCFILGR